MKELHLKNLDITIKSGELIGIIGPNGSGKTILLKKICGRLFNDDIYIDNKIINCYQIEYKINNIVCVFNDNIYNTDNVNEELSYYLNKLNLNKEELNNRVRDFIEYFKLESLIHESFLNLSTEERIYIKILSLLIIIPSLFCVDDLLTYLNKDKKIRILNYIKENNITFLNITSNMEELMLFDKILVMNKGKKEKFDKANVILVEENMFKELGLALPFIYDINNMLKSYELINEDHIVHRELVDILWK